MGRTHTSLLVHLAYQTDIPARVGKGAPAVAVKLAPPFNVIASHSGLPESQYVTREVAFGNFNLISAPAPAVLGISAAASTTADRGLQGDKLIA